jgi:nucleoid-associated protein YgaU
MAFFKGSYYEAVSPFAPDDRGRKVFPGVRARPLAAPEPIVEHAVALKERLDSLAQHYYGEPRDWRRIAEANPDEIFAEDLLWQPEPLLPAQDDGLGSERLGKVVLIPRRREVR